MTTCDACHKPIKKIEDAIVICGDEWGLLVGVSLVHSRGGCRAEWGYDRSWAIPATVAAVEALKDGDTNGAAGRVDALVERIRGYIPTPHVQSSLVTGDKPK